MNCYKEDMKLVKEIVKNQFFGFVSTLLCVNISFTIYLIGPLELEILECLPIVMRVREYRKGR